eukprot:TRINITY_DN6966_c0_g1_i1.p1 TRINITY_DN6966_c0_g1~~TRINITY_DN6966_c0_g1_i1.p1  ORF type:complete len:363 (-),score=77.03 TRINITY_DN6966_c0_g1_i1:44-1132(-)
MSKGALIATIGGISSLYTFDFILTRELMKNNFYGLLSILDNVYYRTDGQSFHPQRNGFLTVVGLNFGVRSVLSNCFDFGKYALAMYNDFAQSKSGFEMMSELLSYTVANQNVRRKMDPSYANIFMENIGNIDSERMLVHYNQCMVHMLKDAQFRKRLVFRPDINYRLNLVTEKYPSTAVILLSSLLNDEECVDVLKSDPTFNIANIAAKAKPDSFLSYMLEDYQAENIFPTHSELYEENRYEDAPIYALTGFTYAATRWMISQKSIKTPVLVKSVKSFIPMAYIYAHTHFIDMKSKRVPESGELETSQYLGFAALTFSTLIPYFFMAHKFKYATLVPVVYLASKQLVTDECGEFYTNVFGDN